MELVHCFLLPQSLNAIISFIEIGYLNYILLVAIGLFHLLKEQLSVGVFYSSFGDSRLIRN